MALEVSVQELIEAGAHFGHKTKRWNPKIKPYIYGSQDGVHIFDLFKTKEAFDKALAVLAKAKKENKKILLVGTKKQAKEGLEEVAREAGVFWVNERWLGGTLTNFDQIKKSTKKLIDMRTKMIAGEYKDRTKKERLLIEREITRLGRFFGGVEEMQEVPDLLFVIDVKREAGAIKEANMKGIETIAIVDSNCDPNDITYPIPMNDDASRAIDYVLKKIREALTSKSNKSDLKSKEVSKKSKKQGNKSKDNKTKKSVKKKPATKTTKKTVKKTKK